MELTGWPLALVNALREHARETDSCCLVALELNEDVARPNVCHVKGTCSCSVTFSYVLSGWPDAEVMARSFTGLSAIDLYFELRKGLLRYHREVV